MLQREANSHPHNTLAFRCQVVLYIFGVWQQRLKAYRPYQQAGFRLYLYEDWSPTISVVAETPYGFPYAGQAIFVDSPMEIMQIPTGSSWQKYFQTASRRNTEPEQLLAAIELRNGSIGRSTANSLHLTIAQLRQSIEYFDLQEAVNRLRKKSGRHPAQFISSERLSDNLPYHIYELKLPAHY